MRPLTWWEWLIADSASIRRLGHDPTQRLPHTGHQRALSSRWAQTIGKWGRSSPASIIKLYRGESETAISEQKARWAYDLFKNRNHLWSPGDWISLLDAEPIDFLRIGGVMIASLAHARVMLWKVTHPTLSLGAAAREAVLYEQPQDKAKEKLNYLGMLPIEALLYYHAIEHVLEESGITKMVWSDCQGIEAWGERADLWKRHECDELVSLPAHALAAYPVDYA